MKTDGAISVVVWVVVALVIYEAIGGIFNQAAATVAANTSAPVANPGILGSLGGLFSSASTLIPAASLTPSAIDALNSELAAPTGYYPDDSTTQGLEDAGDLLG